MQVSLYTLGCKVNYCETEKLKAEFEDAGFKIVNSTANKVDVFVLNSCAVTNEAEKKSRQKELAIIQTFCRHVVLKLCTRLAESVISEGK